MQIPDQSLHDQFLRLFLPQEDSLKGYLRSVLFSHEEVAEVMQDVAVVLWRKFDSTMTAAEFRGWSFGVARMEALSYRRDRARDRHSFGDRVYELLAAAAVEDAEPIDQQRLALETCLQKLPEPQRKLVEQAYAAGVRIDDLAAALGRTAMAVYKSLHRIRIALADCVGRTIAAEELA
jgi:RNA polymerase sigma-70 factor (ECF subfamily)